MVFKDVVLSDPKNLFELDFDQLSVMIATSAKDEKTQLDKEEGDEATNDKCLATDESEAFGDTSKGDKAIEEVYAAAHRREKVNGLKARNANERAKTAIMRWIAKRAFAFMSYWCAFVAFMVFCYFAVKREHVEPEVIMTLLGTTTVSVVGLVGFIVKGLFGVKASSTPKKPKK
jgi:hypothetical protein